MNTFRNNIWREFHKAIKTRIAELQQEIVDRKFTHSHDAAILVGNLTELERILKTFTSVIDEQYNIDKVAEEHKYELPIKFAPLVSQLEKLPDDAPVRFVVLTGIGTDKPLSTLQITMGDLRRFNQILVAFEDWKL